MGRTQPARAASVWRSTVTHIGCCRWSADVGARIDVRVRERGDLFCVVVIDASTSQAILDITEGFIQRGSCRDMRLRRASSPGSAVCATHRVPFGAQGGEQRSSTLPRSAKGGMPAGRGPHLGQSGRSPLELRPPLGSGGGASASCVRRPARRVSVLPPQRGRSRAPPGP